MSAIHVKQDLPAEVALTPEQRRALSRHQQPECPACGLCAAYQGNAIVCLHCMTQSTAATVTKLDGYVVKVWETRRFVPRNREVAE